MSPRPFRFLAVLSTALLLTACGGEDDGNDDTGKPTRTTLRAGEGEYWDAPSFSPEPRLSGAFCPAGLCAGRRPT